MNANWLGVISAVLAFVAFFLVYRVAKGLPLKQRIFYTALALVAALPSLSFTIYYAHIFPESELYYQFRSIRGVELLAVFLGVAGGFFATLLPRVLMAIPLFGVAVLSVVPIIKPFIGPIRDDALRNEWDGDACLQSTPSLATILKLNGVSVTESVIAREAYSYMGGTEAWYLARAARSRGFEAEFVFRSGFDPEVGFPAIVGVLLGDVGHFIPVLGQQGDEFILADPLRGREQLTWDELHQRYAFTGFHMRVRSRE